MPRKSSSSKSVKNNDAVAIMLTVLLFGLFFHGSIMYILKNVKDSNCECAKNDFRQDFCYYYSMFIVGLLLVTIGIGDITTLPMVGNLIQILSFINMIFLVTYFDKLSREECGCEYTRHQMVIRYMLYGWVGIVCIALTILLFAGVTFFFRK